MSFTNLNPYKINEPVGDTGKMIDERKRLNDLTKEALENPHMFGNVEAKRRRKGRVDKNISKMVQIQCEEEIPLPILPSDVPFYIIDNTEGAKPAHERPHLPRYYTGYNVLDFTRLDSNEIDKHGVMLRSKDGRMIAYKLSRQQRSNVKFGLWKRFSKILQRAFAIQDKNNPRGRRKAGQFARYIIFGWRKDGNGTKVHEYAVHGTEDEVSEVKKGLKELIAKMEAIGLGCIPAIDLSILNKLKQDAGLRKVMVNGNKGRFSAIAIASRYWSPVHVDDDIFYTLLSCFSPSTDWDEVLFYFVFPSVGYAIPMRKTDVLVFNSDFPHCSSNYRHDDGISFSLFTNASTATAQMKALTDEHRDLERELEEHFDAMSVSDDGNNQSQG